jgi:predicted nucleic acid-binding protein
MTGRFLLDTNIVIALFDNHPGVTAELANAAAVFTASIVLGELKGNPSPKMIFGLVPWHFNTN